MEADMSRFDIAHTNKDPDEWSQIAYQRVGQNNLQAHVFGGFALAATVAVMSTPITGALVAAYVLWTAVEKGRSQARNFDAVDKGAIAHVLEESEFRAYARQVGEQKLNEELSYAVQEDYKLSDTAIDYLENSNPALLNAPQKVFTLSPQATTDSTTFAINNNIDIVGQLTSRIGNALLIGTPGSGKGMLLANCIRAAKAKHPDLKVFVIDPKADPDEQGYWEGAADVLKSYACERAEPEKVVNFLEKSFKEYYEYWEQHKRVLLILDEGTLIGSKAKTAKSDAVKNFVIAIASAGDSQGRNIWLTSLSPFVGDLGINLNASSQLTAVAIVREVGVLRQWSKASTIEKAEPVAIQALIDESECKRAVYSGVTGQWHSMPTLHNYSAKNRDERKPNGDALSTSDRAYLRTVTDVKTKPVEQVVAKVAKTKFDNLNDFIKHEMKADITDEIKLAVVAAIRDRTDLLEKFNLGWLAIKDPVEALRLWASESKTDEEIREAWLLHTQQHLNDRGVKHLREKLEN
jgi:hypothetical protein